MKYSNTFSQVLLIFVRPLLISALHWGPNPLVDNHLLATQAPFLSFPQTPVSLPHQNPTKSFWTHGSPDANPLAKEGSQGPLTTDADIVIIGSGITGVGVAHYLSELVSKTNLSLNILMLEARSGATGRNGGHLTPSAFNGFRSVTDRYGTDEAMRWLAIENHTTESIISLLTFPEKVVAVDLVDNQHLDLFFSDREETEYKDDWEAAKQAGVDLSGVLFLSRREARQMYSIAYPSVRSNGHNLWPLKAVTHIFKMAQRKVTALNRELKLGIHTQTPVTSITRLKNQSSIPSQVFPRRWRLQTPRGAVSAHTVIHATNGYAAHLLPFMAAAPEREGIVPTRGQVFATRSNVGINTLQTHSYSANDGYEYWFPRPVNGTAGTTPEEMPLVILGGGREAGGPDYEVGISDDSVVNPVVSERLKAFLPKLYPEGWFEQGREPEMEWTGIMGFTKSGDPFVGPAIDYVSGIPLEGQYIAAGYNGHGMPRAFGCAEALVQMMASHLKNESWNVPEWFPNHFLTTSRM